MAYVNSIEKEFTILSEPSVKEKYKALLTEVENCKHEFCEPVYDPEEVIFFSSPRQRWYVDCKKCGTRRYAYAKEKFMTLTK